jgi:hypothetical protein
MLVYTSESGGAGSSPRHRGSGLLWVVLSPAAYTKGVTTMDTPTRQVGISVIINRMNRLCIAISLSFWFHVVINHKHKDRRRKNDATRVLERDYNKQFPQLIQSY